MEISGCTGIESNSPLYELVGASSYKDNLPGTKETRLEKTPAVENSEEKESSRKRGGN